MTTTKAMTRPSKAGYHHAEGGDSSSKLGRRTPIHRLVLFVVSALAIAACQNATDPAAVDRRNPADHTFVGGMIAHQRQAVAMADLAEEQAHSDEVKRVAEKIGDAPELEEMTSLFSEWGVEPEDAGRGGGVAPDGGHPGFLNETEMGILESQSGSRFDRLFLDEMIDHHRGAVQASQDEIAQGESEEAKRLARDIIKMRTTEIADMARLLAEVEP